MCIEVIQRSVVFYRMDEPNLLDKLTAQPVMNQGAVKMFHWAAGVQATKDVLPYV